MNTKHQKLRSGSRHEEPRFAFIVPSVFDLNPSSRIPPFFFDSSGLNDASLVNDTRKNHLSVHYCFSIFYQLDPAFAVVFSFLYRTRIVLLPGLFSTPQLRTDVEALDSGSLQRAEQIVLLIEFLLNLKAFFAFLQLQVSEHKHA